MLDRESGSITFGDGEKGRRPPGAARYSYAGAGKGGTDAEGNYESKVITRHTDGSTTEGRTWVDANGSSGSGFDEAWLYESAPWLMDALYTIQK